jgi:CubicO group peptidase (beta-lactamase class C family)
MQMYLNGGELDGQRVISKASIDEMMKPRIKTPVEGGYFGQSQYGYGLGGVPDVFGRRLVGHSGSIGVCTSYIGMLPEENLGVVVLANGTGYSPMMMALAAISTVLGHDPDELPFERDERLMKKLLGRYETFRGNTSITIERNGSYLMLHEKDKVYDNTTPLAVESLNDDICIFYVPLPEQRLTVEFRIKDDTVDMVYERYLYRKVP